MIPIYICDDNLTILNYLQTDIQKAIMINDYDMTVVLASSDPEQLLSVRATNELRSIYFLDVDLQNDHYNGFTLAKEIRKRDTRGFIIFVTTHDELMPETFKYRVEAMNYIVKDDLEELQKQIRESLSEINNLIKIEKKDNASYYTIKTAESVYQLPMNELLYFETVAPHRITVFSESRMIEFRGDLSQIEKELGANYLRVHQSFLVNKQAVGEINKKNNLLRLKNGSEIPISRRGRRVLL